jgi:hypothetical protein
MTEKECLALLEAEKEQKPAAFDDPDWPMTIAQECAVQIR